jgi:hypothetical protein
VTTPLVHRCYSLFAQVPLYYTRVVVVPCSFFNIAAIIHLVSNWYSLLVFFADVGGVIQIEVLRVKLGR